ncbi:polysaccharide deacetylase family protein [Saccharospirillum mangrovi]|uniref:polysaccharide deacetylase family protein n=1 Tax=Saccharospirillum mangrovi TaxID=2161747 RepID=UPI000D3D9622|nr:polysaccharide deacetylase family protein [Saccharospirillum mangrovi]
MPVRLLCLVLLALCAGPALAQQHFNILVYHHVAEDTPASTSVSPATFRQHLTYLRDNGHPVIALKTALDAVRNDEALPDGAVVITFDDAFKNIYTNAFPLLQEFNAPFTIFAATDPIDQGFNDMLSWDQLREMQAWGATVANHSRDHGYLVRHSPRDNAWREQMAASIRHAQQRLETELGDEVPRWFAYPYGEYSEGLKSILQNENYIGFAQHSGGVYRGSDFYALPRFAAAGVYSRLETLGTKLDSHPMPVNLASVPDMPTTDVQPSMTIRVDDTSDMSRLLNCFVDSAWQDARWIDDHQFQLSAPEPLSPGRHRFNCTAQARSGNFFYWYSQPWLVLAD